MVSTSSSPTGEINIVCKFRSLIYIDRSIPFGHFGMFQSGGKSQHHALTTVHYICAPGYEQETSEPSGG